MAARVKESDVLAGAGAIQQTGRGWTDTRAFVVDQVTSEKWRRKWDAVMAPGIPRIGDLHPIAAGATVQDVSAEPMDSSNATFLVTVSYGGDEDGESIGAPGSGIKSLDVQTQTVSQTTNRDLAGRRMQTVYYGPSVTIETGSTGGIFDFSERTFVEVPSSVISKFGEAEYETTFLRFTVVTERPLPSFGYMRRLGTLPAVNAAPWSGEDAKTWLLLGIDSSSNDSGGHDWRWTLAFNEETWRYKLEVTLEQNYRPLDTTVGNGIEFFDVYPVIDFSSFGFTIPR